MVMPALMSATYYTRPSMQVSSLANENVLSTVDFVGSTVEVSMGSTSVPSFSTKASMDFTQSSIDYESIETFAEDFKEKYEAYNQDLVDAISAMFELVVEKFEAFIHGVSNAVTPTFKVFNEKFETYTQELSDLMSAMFDTIPFECQRVYDKLEPFATDLLAAAPAAWPGFDPEFIAKDVFDGVESYTKDPFVVPAPFPSLPSFNIDIRSIVMGILDMISFGACAIALLVAALAIIDFISGAIDRKLRLFFSMAILETPFAMTAYPDMRMKMISLPTFEVTETFPNCPPEFFDSCGVLDLSEMLPDTIVIGALRPLTMFERIADFSFSHDDLAVMKIAFIAFVTDNEKNRLGDKEDDYVNEPRDISDDPCMAELCDLFANLSTQNDTTDP